MTTNDEQEEQGRRSSREAEIRERAEQASPAPWSSHDTEDGDWVVEHNDPQASVSPLWFGDMERNTGRDIANADFIAHSREDVSWLIDQLEKARTREMALLDSKRKVLEAFRDFASLVSDFSNDPQIVESANRIGNEVDAKLKVLDALPYIF